MCRQLIFAAPKWHSHSYHHDAMVGRIRALFLRAALWSRLIMIGSNNERPRRNSSTRWLLVKLIPLLVMIQALYSFLVGFDSENSTASSPKHRSFAHGSIEEALTENEVNVTLSPGQTATGHKMQLTDDDSLGDDDKDPEYESCIRDMKGKIETISLSAGNPVRSSTKRNDEFTISVYVFGWRRLESLERLIKSLQESQYGDEVIPLTVVLDYDPSPGVDAFSRMFSWPHGPKHVLRAKEPLGIRGLWSTAICPRQGEHPAVFEDDTAVSAAWWAWARRGFQARAALLAASAEAAAAAAAAAAGGEAAAATAAAATARRRLLLGRKIVSVSLYTPRLNEILYPFREWTPSVHGGVPKEDRAFLLGLPCSWGAAYDGAHWRRFRRFLALRARPPFYDPAREAAQGGRGASREPLGDPALALPRCRCNTWPRSWKRFLIDFMYGRGEVALYPHFGPDQASLSTHFQEQGDHTGKDGRKQQPKKGRAGDDSSLRKKHDPLKTVPLIKPDSEYATEILDFSTNLVDLTNLTIFDLHHEQKTIEDMQRDSASFISRIKSSVSESENSHLYDLLFKSWLDGT